MVDTTTKKQEGKQKEQLKKEKKAVRAANAESKQKNLTMKLGLKFWHGLVVMGIIALSLQFRSCSIEKAYESEVAKNLAYKDTLKTYVAKDGTIVEFNNVLQTQFEAFLEAQNDSIKNFLENIRIPKPDVITVFTERFYVDSIPSVGLGITDCEFDTTFQITDSYYEIDGRVTNEELTLNSIMIPNKATLVIGNRKTKWWKKKEYIATIKHSNPYVQTESIGSYTFQDKQSRWSIGPNIGYGFYYDPWKGNVGHGITGGLSINYRLLGWNKR